MIDTIKYKYILASASPRRKELFSMLGKPFVVKKSSVNEKTKGVSPIEISQTNASLKAKDIWSLEQLDKQSALVVIGADTVVHRNNRCWGKPSDQDEARRFLLELEDGWHHVTTSISIITSWEEVNFHVTTDVHFTTIDRDFLELYLVGKDSLDKAGGYGIQGMAQVFIDMIRGSYSNVVGLPMAELAQNLHSLMMRRK